MATHSSVLAWKIPQTEEPTGLQSMGSQRVRHNLATKQNKTKQKGSWNFPGGPVGKTLVFPLQGAQVWSLVGELRSHMLQGVVKTNRRKGSCSLKCLCPVQSYYSWPWHAGHLYVLVKTGAPQWQYCLVLRLLVAQAPWQMATPGCSLLFSPCNYWKGRAASCTWLFSHTPGLSPCKLGGS